jgi:hypothetical protein
MPRDASSTPPTKPDREATRLRLLVQTQSTGTAAERELRQTVRTALGRDATGRQWKVARLFSTLGTASGRRGARRGRVDELASFFQVTGFVSSTYPLPQLGFELAYRLDAAGQFRSVQPDLPSAAFDPERREVGAARAVAPSGEHLTASLPHTWAIEAIRCPEAWALPLPAGGATRGEGISVGHPDTGYALHAEGIQLEALDLTRDYDILANDDDARDPLEQGFFGWLESPGHGTGTGSVIISRAEGPDAIASAAPRATLVPIRAVRSVVRLFPGDVAQAIDYARRAGCHVISMSLGGAPPFPAEAAAIRAAVRDGLIVLAAAGNYAPFVVWPAAYPECIAVAAVNVNDEPWAFSSRGPAVLVSAPGESVWRAQFILGDGPPQPNVARNHGTSFAVAHTAGVAALWLAHHGRDALIARYGRENLQAVFRSLVSTAGHRRPAGWDTANYGVGIVDAHALLSAPLPAPADVTPIASAIRATAAAPEAPSEDAVGAVHAICPELTREEVAARLRALFGARDADLSGEIRRYGNELVYLFTEDPELRAAFVRGEGSSRTRSATAGAAAAPASPGWGLRRLASPTLAAAIAS